MKKTLIIFLFLLAVLSIETQAQNTTRGEKYGNTLNLGLGIGGYAGYYGYMNRSLPVFHANYEFDVAPNFTLAPFVTYFSYRNDSYYYRETVIPIGVKGSYYFDQILNANSKWDFYLAGSLGFSLVNSRYDAGYVKHANYKGPNQLFLDLHIGTEYHVSNRLGLFLDLSTGVSTVGIAIH